MECWKKGNSTCPVVLLFSFQHQHSSKHMLEIKDRKLNLQKRRKMKMERGRGLTLWSTTGQGICGGQRAEGKNPVISAH